MPQRPLWFKNNFSFHSDIANLVHSKIRSKSKSESMRQAVGHSKYFDKN